MIHNFIQEFRLNHHARRNCDCGRASWLAVASRSTPIGLFPIHAWFLIASPSILRPHVDGQWRPTDSLSGRFRHGNWNNVTFVSVWLPSLRAKSVQSRLFALDLEAFEIWTHGIGISQDHVLQRIVIIVRLIVPTALIAHFAQRKRHVRQFRRLWILVNSRMVDATVKWHIDRLKILILVDWWERANWLQRDVLFVLSVLYTLLRLVV